MENIEATLSELVKGYCTGEITEDTDLYERGMNSLNSIEFLVDIEDKFGVSFEAEELRIQNLKTIKDFQVFIEAKLEAKANGKT